MTLCKFCSHELDGLAKKKCAVCGEPQGWRTYPSAMFLKYTPLGSIIVAVLSLGFARFEKPISVARSLPGRDGTNISARQANRC